MLRNMVYKVFLDVNLILDFILKRKNFDQAKAIFVLLEEKRISGFVSPTVVQICGYWTTKAYGAKKAKQILTTLLGFVQVIDTQQEQVLMTLHSSMEDVEDALLYYTALHHRLDFVISNDKIFQQSALPSLPVVSPTEFMEINFSV